MIAALMRALFLESGFGANESGRIRIHNLVIFTMVNAKYSVTGGLGLGGSDAELPPQELVEEGRFTGIGFADDAHKAGTVWFQIVGFWII